MILETPLSSEPENKSTNHAKTDAGWCRLSVIEASVEQLNIADESTLHTDGINSVRDFIDRKSGYSQPHL